MTPDLRQQINEESKRFREDIKAEPDMTKERLEELSRIHKENCRKITDHYLSEHYAH